MSKQVLEVKITTEFITLDQLLKFSGVAETGGMAKDIVLNEEVSVNGEICSMRGKKIRKGDKVTLDDIEINII